MEWGATGGEHAKRRHRRKEISGQRRRVQHLLEIIEHQQRRSIAARDGCAPG
jgi:hypothetical protein